MKTKTLLAAAAAGLAAVAPFSAFASSHMDAPLITFDDAANTTDVYAFLSEDAKGQLYLTTALSVFPFEEPGIGPNAYRFDDRVRYSIHVAFDENATEGKADLTYNFDFSTQYDNQNTILQAFQGVVAPNGDNQNLQQTYRVTKVVNKPRKGKRRGVRGRALGLDVLGAGKRDGLVVPPNNQGRLTPLYNQNDDGDMRAKEGVASIEALDPYTKSGIAKLKDGYIAFAGQRDDGFYADIQSIFDLDLSFGRDTGTPTKPFDSQGGFNVHTIVLNIPIEELEGAQIAGVYATTSRRKFEDFKRNNGPKSFEDFGPNFGTFDQVGRQGNPLFVEALLPINRKDGYNQGSPKDDFDLRDFAAQPELAGFGPGPLMPGLLEQIFIPDLIKVDLTTGPAKLAGEEDFDRLGVFGGDVLKSQVQDPFANGGFIPGGWPNGRRFGDDVVDIAVIALGLSGIVPEPDDDITEIFSDVNIDRVDRNDITFNDVFPYAATPLNGRNHGHHDESDGE
ncbi:MAG: DUF4331 domain-containing protein [Pseudomonadota bacterium]